MIRFKAFINEGKYPLWVRVTVGSLVIKIKNLQVAIDKEEDAVKQNKLIARQNTLQSYITGLGVGISSTDQVLMKRLKSLQGRR